MPSFLWKYIIIGVVIIAALGYFKWSQDHIATLNREIATKELSLKIANETLKKQAEDIKRQSEIQTDLNSKFDSARESLSRLEARFAKQDLDKLSASKPNLIQKRVNSATKRTLKCIEELINEGKQDGKC